MLEWFVVIEEREYYVSSFIKSIVDFIFYFNCCDFYATDQKPII